MIRSIAILSVSLLVALATWAQPTSAPVALTRGVMVDTNGVIVSPPNFAAANAAMLAQAITNSGLEVRVPTMAALQLLQPVVTNQSVLVQGLYQVGDWGDAKRFWWDSTNSGATNAILRSVVTGVGRWRHEWDGDARAFGALGYRADDGPTPWMKRMTSSAVGSSDFSVYIRFKVPLPSPQSIGLLSVNRSVTTDAGADPLNASFEIYRGSGTEFSILSRATNSSSASGSTLVEAAKLQASAALIDVFAGTSIDLVVTRAGTSVNVYIGGTNVTGSFTVSNAAGLAKSLGSGDVLDWIAGTTVANAWNWPEEITRMVVWTKALNASEAQNPAAVGGKLFDHNPGTFPAVVDQAPLINSALLARSALGGGVVRLPVAKFALQSPIFLQRDVTLEGASAVLYPNNGNRPSRTAPSVLVPWHGYVGDTIIVTRTNAAPEPFLVTRQLWGLGNGVASSRFVRAGIRNLAIDGGMAWATRGVVLDRVGSVLIDRVTWWHVPGAAIYGTANNSVSIINSWAQTHRGMVFRSMSDSFIHNTWVDGAAGPALWLAGNGVQITGSTFEFSRDPRAAPAFEQQISVNTATDTITADNHRYLTGDVIRFENEGGSLPGGLSASADYFVIRTATNSFKVSLKYCDESTGGGALGGSDVVDITSAGSGTNWVTPGPSNGVLLQGDGNTITGSNLRGSWDDNLRMETFGENRIGQNNLNLAGYQNPDRTNGTIASIRMVASPRNSVTANRTDDRENALASQVGILGDAASTEPYLAGNSFDIATPYQFAGTGIWWSDGSGSFFPYDGGVPRLYLPSAPTFTALDPIDRTNTFTPLLARDAKRLHVSTDSTTSGYWYAPLLPSQTSQWAWRGLTDGSWSGVNNGTGSAHRSVSGTYASSQDNMQVNAPGTGEGYRTSTLANASTNNTTFAGLGAGRQIRGDYQGGWWGTGSGNIHFTAILVEGYAASAWNSTNAHSGWRVRVAPSGTTSAVPALDLEAPTSLAAQDSMMVLYVWNGSTWVGKRVTLGAADSGGTGFRALRVAN